MSALHATIDLDDADGLIAADRDGLLRAASMAGAQVRATASAVDEGALDGPGGLGRGERPRSVIWVAGRGAAESAGAILAATAGGAIAVPIVLAAEVPPWIGPLDVLVVAGDDPGDPVLAQAAATGVRRGARVVVAAPYEGPLRDITAGRVSVLAPRVWVPDEFALSGYLAAGLATLERIDPAVRVDLAALADELDAEALRNSAGRELFTNAAKSLADQMTDRSVILAGDNAATLALARHLSAPLLRAGHRVAAAVGLGDAITALQAGAGQGGGGGAAGLDDVAALFHDEELDGPLPDRLRVFALTLAADRSAVAARAAAHSDIVLVGAEDVPDVLAAPVEPGRPEQQLATLAVRLQMAAVYLRLVRG
ncbi:MAG TPA: TobH protein [Mycobacterium sp.]|nr:TobH protein [Mycobacterium sp.]